MQAFEDFGGALLRETEPVEMGAGALDAVLDILDDTPEDEPAKPLQVEAGPLPGVLMEEIGIDFDEIPWRFQLPGVAGFDLSGFEDEHVSILRAKPGAKVPQHTHEGIEMTLVLQGQLSDGGVIYSKGDLAINDEHDDHRPQITGEEVCYCLIVRRGDLRFTGTFSRFLNYLGE